MSRYKTLPETKTRTEAAKLICIKPGVKRIVVDT